MAMKTSDLNEPAAPEAIPTVLRFAADKMLEQAAELESAWQDKNAGKPWGMIALELQRAADRIESKL